MEWNFWHDGWEYTARYLTTGLEVRRCVKGRPWLSPPKNVAQSALDQMPR